MKVLKSKVIFVTLFCAVIASESVFAQTFKRFEVKEKTGELLALETKTIQGFVVPKDRFGKQRRIEGNFVVWWEIVVNGNYYREEERSARCPIELYLPEQIHSFEVSEEPISDSNVKKVLEWANNEKTRKNYKYKKLPKSVNDITAAQIFAWCNAFSESKRLEPVYYNGKEEVIRNGDSYDIYIVKINPDANGYRVPFISECYAMKKAGMKLPLNEIATSQKGVIPTRVKNMYDTEICAVYNCSDNVLYAVNEKNAKYNFYVVKNK